MNFRYRSCASGSSRSNSRSRSDRGRRQAAVDQLGEQLEELVGLGRFVRHASAANRLSMQCINCFLILDSETFVAASDLPTRCASSRIERPEL